mmetsp:Transcript_46072/g.81066  ORF Transcript_46072/g.81066 Transcript_46072/m.81066 type:complete len:372 (+) Transcript_46072:235-1350(+)
MRDLPILKISLLHNALPDKHAVVVKLWSCDVVVIITVITVVVIPGLVLSPLDAPHHQLPVPLHSAWAALNDDNVGHARARNATSSEVKLLRIHIYLEQVSLVAQVFDFESQHLRSWLLFSHPLLLLLGLPLFCGQLAGLVSLLVLLSSLLDLLPNFAFYCGWICKCLITQDTHQVGHLDFGRWWLKNTHLDLVSDLLSALLALQTPQLLSLLGGQVHHWCFGHLLLSRDLDRDRVLHVRRDLFNIHLCVHLLLAIVSPSQEWQIPPLYIGDGLAPHYFWLDLLHANVHLGLLLFLVHLCLLLLLLFTFLFLLLVNAQGLLLNFLYHPLLFSHNGPLFYETESLPLLPFKVHLCFQRIVNPALLGRSLLLEA